MTETMITLDELVTLVNTCAGVALSVQELAKDPNQTFTDLAVDSLGLLGVAAEVELRYGLEPDSQADSVATPLDLLRFFSTRLVQAGIIKTGHTEQAIVIDAPYEVVWGRTNDVANWPDLFSEYADATILEQSEDTIKFRLTMHPDENGMVWSWVSQRVSDRDAGVVRATRVETGPFEFMDITWSYRQLPQGVEMRWVQDFAMKQQAPATTEQMTAHISANSVIQLALIRDRVEAGARAGAPA